MAWTAFPGAVVFSWENEFLFQSRKRAKSIFGLIRDYFSLDNKGWIILEKEVSFLASYQLSLWSNLTFVSPYFVTSNWKFFKMTLSEGQLPFVSNLILSLKFCDFGFGLAMSEDKRRAEALAPRRLGTALWGAARAEGSCRERPRTAELRSELSAGQDRKAWEVAWRLRMLSRTRESGQGSDGGKHVPRVEGSTEGSLVICLEGIEKERENTHTHISGDVKRREPYKWRCRIPNLLVINRQSEIGVFGCLAWMSPNDVCWLISLFPVLAQQATSWLSLDFLSCRAPHRNVKSGFRWHECTSLTDSIIFPSMSSAFPHLSR